MKSENDLGRWHIPASRLYLPRLEFPPATILEHLTAHFPHVSPRSWHERVARGLITADDGTIVHNDSPYRDGITVFYRKEVPSEPASLLQEIILYRDAELIVIDKPHGMPVTPAGEYLERSLLVRLQKITGLATLVPVHRLDRDTAGIIIFAINPDARGHYHRLFAERRIDREYLAVAHIDAGPDWKQRRVENRIEAGEPWYRQRIAEGAANAVTEIQLLDVRENRGLFRLRPESGRKHQLRLHMASIGCPIVGDCLYPEIRQGQQSDPPMQLLATRLAFVDPMSGQPRIFTSARKLLWCAG